MRTKPPPRTGLGTLCAIWPVLFFAEKPQTPRFDGRLGKSYTMPTERCHAWESSFRCSISDNACYTYNSMYRTHRCGELRAGDSGTTVTLAGWVNTRRDHGGIIFIDLRDSTGVCQLRFDPKTDRSAWEVANTLRSEFVLQVTGDVVARPKDMVNPKLPTGMIEVNGRSPVILNTAKTPPFPIDKETAVSEDVRLKHRYLDLRRKSVREKIEFRATMVSYIRAFLTERGFLEIETPILGKSTPEGARDYLVPSRTHPGKFYALPQSPQQYKQLLMVGGFDKYFQIAPCFRDEDARADRAPDQFYQLDLEMAFVEQNDILALIEELFTSFARKHVLSRSMLASPWPRLTYDEAVAKYGTDKPDLRFGLELQDVTALAHTSAFKVFTDAAMVKAIACPKGGEFSRKVFEELTELAQQNGAKGLAWAKVKHKTLESPIAKFLSDDHQEKLCTQLKAGDGDAIFFVADDPLVVHAVLGALRTELAERLKLADDNILAFAFVVDFPLFEEQLENGHYAPKHHMFTRPKTEDIALLDSDPHKVRSWQHDMVLNGVEVGGGSVRIHERALQETIFKLIGFDLDKARKDFGHMLEAFEYGAPPHGGIAPGIDRLVMMFLNEPNVREVVAFPKTGDNRDVTLGAPSDVEPQQLKDLHLRLTK